MDIGPQDFIRILEVLRSKIPEQALHAQESLSKFQECHRIVQVHVKCREGKDIKIGREVARRSQRAWDISHARMLLVQI